MNSLFIVDHSSKLGGGQLAVARYLKSELRTYYVTMVLFEDGPLAEIARNSKNCRLILVNESSILKKIIKLNSIISDRNGLILANSLPAFLYLSLTPKASCRIIKYLRQEAYPHNASKAKQVFIKYFAYPRSLGFLANSEFTKQSLISEKLIKKTRVVYTISGINSQNAKPSQINANPLKVLSLSRLTPWKGVHNIINSVHLANRTLNQKAVHLTVAGGNIFGEDNYKSELDSLAAIDPESVQLIGNVSDVDSLLRSHDVLVSASVLPEPFGQIIVQGMNAGLLTIATNQGGAKEIISHGVNGVLTESDNVKELADTLLWVISNPDEINSIKDAGLSRAEDFSDSSMINLFESSLKAFIN